MSERTDMNLKEVLEHDGFFKMSAKLLGTFKDKENNWEHRAWDCTITVIPGIDRATKFGVGKMSFEERFSYKTGMGIKGVPELADVLGCIVIDSSAIEQSFEDWASEYGYDTDSRKAEAIYEACKENGYRLRKLLGSQYMSDLRKREW